jgi:hypothetical protein
MVKLNTSEYLPPLRLVEDNMSDDHIRQTLDTAFGKRETVKTVRKSGIYTIVYLRLHNRHPDCRPSQPMSEWDKFYEDLDEHGSLWMDFTKMASSEYRSCVEYYYKHPIQYSVDKKEGHWEIQYAIKNQGPRISTTSDSPRYVPPPPRRSARFMQEKRTITRTVSVDLPPIATTIPDATSVCIATVVSIVKKPATKKWYSCLLPF